MKHKTLAAAALLGVAAAAAPAQAGIDFVLTTTGSEITVTGGVCLPFCGLSTNLLFADNTSFSLEEGEFETFNFAEITPWGFGGGTADIKATLAFIEPFEGTASSTGDAIYFTVFGVFDGGALTWTNPEPIETSSGTFSLTFHDLLGFDIDWPGNGVPVKATITALDVTEVPEPAALALFGLGLVGLAAARRRKAA